MDPKREEMKNRIERLLRKSGMSDKEINDMFEEYSPYKDGWIKIIYQKMISENRARWNISREEYQDLQYAVDLLIEPKY
ncbi:MAG: hypothetical protein LLF83_00850 [Methanobacterium sp.]|nr:hypothetical protein [Methanobacterium sp.]